MRKPSDLVQGTLDLLILKTISLEPKHGWAVAKRGRTQLEEELANWDRLSPAISIVIEMA